MDRVEDSPAAMTGPQPRRTVRRRLAIATVLLAVAIGAGFVWWGNPRLSEGGMVGPGAGMSWANDGIENTRMVVRGRPVATVSATFSIHNGGHLPFTVHGLDVTGMIDWLSRQRVTFLPGPSGPDKTAIPLEEVTLGPDDNATVLWLLDMACRPALAEGVSMTIDALRFRVSWLGIPATRELRLERPITFVGDGASEPPANADCASSQNTD